MSSPIAIVGLACELPGAHSPAELWENVLAGRRFFRKTPPERLPPEYLDANPAVPGKSYCDQMAVLSGWTFDPVEFRLPPVTFQASDLAHWLALATARAALRSAGVDSARIDRTRIGVILGNSLTGEFSRSHTLRFRWPYVERSLRRALGSSGLSNARLADLIAAVRAQYEAPFPEITEDSLPGNMANIIAGRICNYFDFGGGGFTVDGACASSLLSVVLACESLLRGDMDVALAGGVDLSLDPFEIVGFAKARALAADDIRPYDERAAGMLTGEGCGILVLSTEAHAQAAGYPIRARIRGWGYSSDGAGGITAPEVEGQVRALRQAYARAGYDPGTVALIEGHGTGTPLGDQVEITAARRVFESASADRTCWIGSIKANIGHCKAAAGVAGLIKAVLALERKIIPPTVNCERPNSAFGLPGGRLRPSLTGRVWERAEVPRRAAVSAMGFGGTNAHVTLEEANPTGSFHPEDLALLGSAQSTELIPFAGETAADLLRQLQQILPLVRRLCRAELTDLAAALAGAPLEGDFRLSLVVDSPWCLVERLEACAAKLAQGSPVAALDDPGVGVWAGVRLERPSWVALFPGQGSGRLNMGEHWRRRFPFVRAFYEQVASSGRPGNALAAVADKVFRDVLGADEGTRDAWDQELRDTRFAQPAIVLSSLATQKVLEFFGLHADLAIGHSLGEICALEAVRVLTAPAAVRLAALRGQIMASLALPEPGAMAAIGVSSEKMASLLEGCNSNVTIANFNGPRQTVVSGPSVAVRELASRCERAGVRCRLLAVSHAFHSELVAPAAVAFQDAIRKTGDLFPLHGVPFPVEAGSSTGPAQPGTNRPGIAASAAAPARIISTVTGQRLAPAVDWPAYLADQIRRPVRFVEAVQVAAEAQPALWIEVGPGGTLSALVREILGANSPCCVPTDLAGEDGFDLLNRLLACAWVLGFPVRLDRLFAHRFHRPFAVERFNPQFIVNPCERPVEVQPPPLSLGEADLPAALRPPEANAPDFADYLARRAPFLRRLIALDYCHAQSPGASTPSAGAPDAVSVRIPARVSEPDQGPPKPVSRAPSDAGPETRESLLTFALDWLARRTGFPRNALKPEQRLRDDLNLDSIKVGELALLLTQRARRESEADPTAFANARLIDLVGSILSRSAPAQPNPTVTVHSPGAETALSGLGAWVRTFHVLPEKAPLPRVQSKPLPASGAWLIVAECGCAHAKGLAAALQAEHVEVRHADFDLLTTGGHAPADMAVLIVLLPEIQRLFIEGTAEEFEQRVVGTATRLFRTFRWAGHGLSQRRLRGLVLRPIGQEPDAGKDLDGGSGLFRSLGWEYPDADFKWVSLPGQWPGARWARVVLDELQTDAGGLALTYEPDGLRWGEAASPVAGEWASHGDRGVGAFGPLPIGPDDVVLVSGGAKGITCELALELGRRTGARLVLLGSSPPPVGPASAGTDEVGRNLARYRELGLRYVYAQADVTDLEAVARVVREAEQTLGPATAILHGAGVTQLRPFREKTLEEFLGCVRVKAQGLYNLLRVAPPARLKALHVVSSVLGCTGMRGQSDYALANAWLNGAVQTLSARYPQLHCLALGYSAWAETGLAQRLGTLENLRARGVEPIRSADGVAAYGTLLERRSPGGRIGLAPDLGPKATAASGPRAGVGSCYVITGRLAPELESRLYGATDSPRGRFLARVRRWVPGTELIADSTLSHGTDLYLPEHVFEGTALFPGVMGLEAMTQAALACAGRTDLPVLRAVRFGRPLVVAPDTPVVLRVMALTDPRGREALRVRLAIRSEQDGFRENLVEAEGFFGEPPEEDPARLALPLPPKLDRDPEEFSPVPLFQGKFFRRISAVRRLTMGDACLADIRVPINERYFAEFANDGSVTPSPAARDACLQAGALILPPGALPLSIDKLRFHACPRPGDTLVCRASVRSHTDNQYVVDLDTFTPDGRPLETMRGLRLQTTGRGQAAPVRRTTPPLPADRVQTDLDALLPKTLLAIALVAHSDRSWAIRPAENLPVTSAAGASPLRQRSERANRWAAGLAAAAFLRTHRGLELAPDQVTLVHGADGKPALQGTAPLGADRLEELTVSVTDSDGSSIAVVGTGTLGVDLEPVECRDCETWRGLLGDDGYDLAMQLAGETAEPFDLAATRVWTLLEATKKAVGGVRRAVPRYHSALGGCWLAFAGGTPETPLELLSTVIDLHAQKGAPSVLTLAVAASKPGSVEPDCMNSSRRDVSASAFETIQTAFRNALERLRPHCAGDPDAPGCTRRHAEFLALIDDTARRLAELERETRPADLAPLRHRFQQSVLGFLDGSENFRHTLVKPLGYAGDFRLLEMLVRNQCSSRGLAYHFDRAQLDAPAAAACRERVVWIAGELESLARGRAATPLRLLDLGIGSAPIEQQLLADHPELAWKVHAVDLEPAALKQASDRLSGSQREVVPWRWDLRDAAVMPQLAGLVAEAEVCLAVGLLEALTDAEALILLRTVRQNLAPGARFYAENFLPTHPTRPILEWFLDFHLAYRSADALRSLFEQAGADPTRTDFRPDATGSVTLVRLTR